MNWLKQRRIELKLRQEDLAAKLQLAGISVTHSAISHWESGRYRPPFEDERFQEALADILKMDVTYMLNLAGYKVKQVSHSEEAEEIAHIVDKLSPEKKSLAVRIIKELAKEEPL
jgi:transcriptional regulator with XRE-family HTH domain